MRAFFMTACAVAVFASAGQSLDLSTVCLKTSADSLLAGGAINLSASGTCDSVTMSMDTTIGGFPVKIPVLVLKKLSNCELSMKGTLGAAIDTVINYCDLAVVTGVPSVEGFPSISVHNRGELAIISFSVPASASGAVLQIVDARGAVVRTFSSLPGRGTVSWNGTDIRGRALGAGRYVAIVRAGVFTTSIVVTRN